MARRPATQPSTEAAIQMAIVRFLNVAWPADLPWVHFPAGGLRDKATAGKMKALGLRAGWPDLQFLLPKGQIGFIEVKRPGESLSDAQIAFRSQAVALGCGYRVARSVDDVEQILSGWLALYGRQLRARVAA